METNDLKEMIKLIGETLILAQEHLDYCGYGDSYERECARESKLEDKIDDACIHYLNVKDQI